MKVMEIRILSYNLHFHKAYKEAFWQADVSGADIVCLQECNANELHEEIAGYTLAGNTESNFLGLAIYYRGDRLQFIDASSHLLPLSFYERIVGWRHERFLKARFVDRASEKEFTVASFHATHLVASNALRRRQLKEVFSLLEDAKSPVVVAGDYNYPMFYSKLKAFAKNDHYELVVPARATFKSRRFKGKFDFISTKNARSARLSILASDESDHLPILARVKL